MNTFAVLLGNDYSVQQFLVDMMYSFNGFAPYVISGAVVLGVLNHVVGWALDAVRIR